MPDITPQQTSAKHGTTPLPKEPRTLGRGISSIFMKMRNNIAALRCLVILAIYIFSCTTIAVARMIGFSFLNVIYISAAGSLAIICTYFYLIEKNFFQGKNILFTMKKNWVLILFSIAWGVFASSINAPEEDDVTYSAPVISALENMKRPLSLGIDWLVPWQSGAPVKYDAFSLLTNFEYFQGAVSHLLHVDFLWLHQVAGSFLFGALFFLVNYNFSLALSGNKWGAFAGTVFALTSNYVLFRANNGNGYGIMLDKIWIGKAVLGTIASPAIASISFIFLKTGRLMYWLLNLFLVISLSTLSTSSIFLLPSLLLCCFLGSFPFLIKEKFSKAVIYKSIMLIACGFPVYLFAIYARFHNSAELVAAIKSVDMPQQSLFWTAYKSYMGEGLSVELLALSICIAYLLFNKSMASKYLLGFLIGVLLIINPVNSNWIASHVTSQVVYGRLFFLLPLCSILSFVIADFFSRIVFYTKIRANILSPLFLLVMVFEAAIFMPKVLKNNLDSPNKANYIGRPYIGFPKIRIGSARANDFIKIKKALPAGDTMSSLEYMLTTSIFSSQYRQYYPWTPEAILFYGMIQHHDLEAKLRFDAAKFLGWDSTQKNRFEEFARTVRPDNFIVAPRYWLSKNYLRSFLIPIGYRLLNGSESDQFCSPYCLFSLK